MGRSVIGSLSPAALAQVREQLGRIPKEPTNKYRAKKVVVDGIKCDSMGEGRRIAELLLMQRAKQIRDFKPHPKYPLVINGIQCGIYTADAEYVLVPSGEVVIEDYKSPATLTEASRLRIKVFEALYGKKVIFVGV